LEELPGGPKPVKVPNPGHLTWKG